MNVFVCDGRQPEARGLRDRAAAERPARHHGAHVEPVTRAERHPRGRGPEVAGARRRLPGRAAPGNAGEGRRRGRGSAPPRSAGCRCSDHLKEIVYRCIGERRKRYESADELIEALRHPPAALKVGRLRTLKGVHLAFTGILSKRRSEAARAARRAGAIVHGVPSAKTTVVVRGRPNPLQAAGRDAGLKLHGDQAAAREGTPHHAAQRDAVLAAGRQALSGPDRLSPRALNRALLARQLLLRRAKLSPAGGDRAPGRPAGPGPELALHRAVLAAPGLPSRRSSSA